MRTEKSNIYRSESGFTLIELLTIIGIVGILASLSLTSLKVYKSDAGYSVAEKTLMDARIALEAGITATESGPDTVPLYVQKVQGALQNAGATELLPGMRLPYNVKFQVEHDNECDMLACQAELIQVDHCHSNEFIRWVRFGDGSEFQFDNVAGGDCT
ncbi:MAG: type II secretion system protein [Bdellovibrionales bacterium]|nr:type II secretion system protein [Bdellovibrionales bacterium]